MKYCPICDTRFDEEIIRFCTKDGTPLIEESEPTFIEMPSESIENDEDDIAEITVIRRKDDVPKPPPSLDEELRAMKFDPSPQSTERIVIPTIGEPREQSVRSRTTQVYYPPTEVPNTAKTVVLTIIGTLAVLGLGVGLFWFLQKEKPAVSNINTNFSTLNTNINTNLGFDSNFNFNSVPAYNANYNFNSGFNTNFKIPTPTPTPKPIPSITPTPTPAASPSTSPTPAANTTMRSNSAERPLPSPTPRTGPRPTPNPVETP